MISVLSASYQRLKTLLPAVPSDPRDCRFKISSLRSPNLSGAKICTDQSHSHLPHVPRLTSPSKITPSFAPLSRPAPLLKSFYPQSLYQISGLHPAIPSAHPVPCIQCISWLIQSGECLHQTLCALGSASGVNSNPYFLNAFY